MSDIEAMRRVEVKASFLPPTNAEDRPIHQGVGRGDGGIVVVIHSPSELKGRFYIRATVRKGVQLDAKGVWMCRTHLQIVTIEGKERVSAVKFDNRYYPVLSLERSAAA